jgi:hypothetical protein
MFPSRIQQLIDWITRRRRRSGYDDRRRGWRGKDGRRGSGPGAIFQPLEQAGLLNRRRLLPHGSVKLWRARRGPLPAVSSDAAFDLAVDPILVVSRFSEYDVGRPFKDFAFPAGYGPAGAGVLETAAKGQGEDR